MQISFEAGFALHRPFLGKMQRQGDEKATTRRCHCHTHS